MKFDEPRSWAMGIGSLAAGAVGVACCVRWEMLTSMLALLGAALGWLTGTLAVPLSTTETERFGNLSKVISGFFSGYALSKLDPLIATLVAVDPVTRMAQIAQPDVAVRTVVCLSSYAIALLMVFCARSYWSRPAA